jgi:hypothetical protein
MKASGEAGGKGSMADMQHDDDPAYDWVDDDELSAEETLRRFAALSPVTVELPTASGGPVVVSIASANRGAGAIDVVVEQLWPSLPDQEQLVS